MDAEKLSKNTSSIPTAGNTTNTYHYKEKFFLVMLKKMCIFAAINVGTVVPLFIAYDRQIQGFRPN